MRTGFIFPVSSNVLGAALIITLIIGAIYVVFYWIQSASDSSIKNSIENGFLDSSSKESKMDFFGLPNLKDNVFVDRSINSDRGYIYIKSSGRFSMAICSHAKLDFLRFCFAIDFTNIGSFQAIVYIEDTEQKHMVKITPETAMFSLGNVKFYECNTQSLKALYSKEFFVHLGDDKIYPTSHEKYSIQESINYVANLDGNFKKKFLDGLNFKSEFFG
jgi:hypothetical protein